MFGATSVGRATGKPFDVGGGEFLVLDSSLSAEEFTLL